MEIGAGARWASRIIAGLFSAIFLMSAFMKFQGGGDFAKGMEHLGMSPELAAPLGVVELTCVLLYWIPATSMLGAILLTGYMGGVIFAHLRVGDPIFLPIGIGVAVWGCLFLVEPRLQALIPFRRPSV